MKVTLPPEPSGLSPHHKEFPQRINSATHVRGELGPSYNVRAAWEKALKKCDPLFSPHGFLRSLQPGNNHHALEFLATFGPLTIPQAEEHVSSVDVDLQAFWRDQQLFSQLIRLYEVRDEPRALKDAWRIVIEHRPPHEIFKSLRALEFFAHTPGLIRPSPELLRTKTVAQLSHFMMRCEEARRDLIVMAEAGARAEFPESGSLPFGLSDILTRPTKVQHAEALGLLYIELNRHVGERLVKWHLKADSWTMKVSAPNSLWDMIWELFAMDSAGIEWRVCPHCNRLFYPPRRDRYYCTSRQQILASKRDYARRTRKNLKKEKKDEHF